MDHEQWEGTVLGIASAPWLVRLHFTVPFSVHSGAALKLRRIYRSSATALHHFQVHIQVLSEAPFGRTILGATWRCSCTFPQQAALFLSFDYERFYGRPLHSEDERTCSESSAAFRTVPVNPGSGGF